MIASSPTIKPTEALPDLRSIYVPTERDTAFETMLSDLLQRGPDGEVMARPKQFTATGETRGLMVVAKTGSGKTTMIQHVLATLDVLKSDNPDRKPWIGIQVPSNVTMKSLGLKILEELGYAIQNPRNVSEYEIWRMVAHRLKLLGTVVLWIDEAQDLFRTKGQIETRHILNTIKNQMQGEASVIVILSGVQELEQITHADRQITRRLRKMHMPDLSEAVDGDRLWTVIERFCNMAGLVAEPRGDLVGRLVHACRGRFGLIIETLVDAIEIAAESGDTALERQHLAEVFAAQTACAMTENVFLTERWSQIDMDRLSFG